MKKTLCSTGLRWLWLAIAVVVLDLGTKQYFMQTFRLYESVAVMPFSTSLMLITMAQLLAF